MSQPTEDTSPGSPRWYLSRLTERLLGRQYRYNWLEKYALGHHPFPNGDKRFVYALSELQRKCRTNYCELVIHAVTQRMFVNGFQFGPDEQVDEDAKKIMNYNYMDVQIAIMINMAATFGDAYMMVSPAIEDDGEPVLTAENPRMCITDPDPALPLRERAGFKMWQDDVSQKVMGVLYLPEAIYTYEAPGITDQSVDTATLTSRLTTQHQPGSFVLVDVQPNEAGEVPLKRCNWQPAFGTIGRSEFESVIDIQDRINHTVLDRLVIAKSQAYNQRWVSGAKKGSEFKPGADMVWATLDPTARFGQFEAADLTQVMEAVRDDVGDMAAISQTPATYLMNRMVNVSGDTLTQDQSALVTKIGVRQIAVGYTLERCMRLAMKLKGLEDKAKETEVMTLWKDAAIHTYAELGDLFSKLTSGGCSLDVAMKITGLFTNDQIESAVKQAEEAKLQEQQFAEKQLAVAAAKTANEPSKKPAPSKGANPSGKE